MFILKDYIKKGFLEAIGKMGDYQIILNSAGWFEKGVLTEDDLAEIQSAIDAQYPQVEDEVTTDDIITDGVIENEVSEEPTEENTEVIENEESTETVKENETVETEVIS